MTDQWVKCEGCGEDELESKMRMTDDDVYLCPPCMDQTVEDTERFMAENPLEAAEMGLTE